jgi:phage major head subunit gpT-like protein
MIVRTDVVGRLERGAKVNFLKAKKEYRPKRAAFCKETPSDGAFEMYVDMGAVPFPSANGGQGGDTGTDGRTGHPQVGGLHEGGPVTILGGNERGLTVHNRDWPITIGIYHNAINDDRVGGLEQWARSASWRFEQHKDYLAFQLLNSGGADTYGHCYDGQNFFSASHADPGAEYTTAQDNEYALSLSLDNFETVFNAAGLFVDDRGEPCGFEHTLLIHALELRRTAAQIVDNQWAYDVANREINPYRDGVTGLQAPGGYLDSSAWFLVDPSQPAKPVNLQIRQQPQLVYWDDYSQVPSGIRYYSWVARYEGFYGDWRLCIQGNT